MYIKFFDMRSPFSFPALIALHGLGTGFCNKDQGHLSFSASGLWIQYDYVNSRINNNQVEKIGTTLACYLVRTQTLREFAGDSSALGFSWTIQDLRVHGALMTFKQT